MSQRSLRNRFAVLAVITLLLNPAAAFSTQNTPELKKAQSYKSISAKVVETIPLPKGWHEGLSLNAGNLWVANGKNGKIWVVDTGSRRLLSDIQPVAGFTEGVSNKSGDLFFTTDWDQRKLYLARLEDNKLNKELWVSFPGSHPAGVVWNGKQLFVITWTRGLGTKFDLLTLDGNMNYSGKVSIKDIQEPAHMAWDGENLWVTSWYDQLVYKVDIDKWEIVASFRSPVSKTTGIAWDGKHIWLTGTYSDLYKLEIAEEGGAAMNIVVTSSAFKEGEEIPGKYTCDGEDMSPPLAWAGLPPGTRSIALISDDPDAPGGTWVHWVAFNISPERKGLPENMPADKILPDGAVQGVNDSHQIGYGGPCPPSGVHRYYFKVYALDTKISLEPGAAKKDLEKAMAGHVLAEGQLMGRYKRK